MMKNEELHIKEVYAYFGLASYMAQCLERSIAMILIFVHGKGPTEITRAELDEVLNKKFKMTMGQLIKELISDKKSNFLGVDFDLALEKRNWLMHNYFYERSGHFMTPEGRNIMLVELTELRVLFEKIDNILEEIVSEKVKEFGVSEEKVQEYITKSLAF